MNLVKMIRSAGMTSVCLGVAVLAFASTASAFSLRSPQIPFNTSVLQPYLNSVDGGINVTTQQLDAQTFQTSVSGNADFTLLVKLTSYAAGNSIGVYNTLDQSTSPALFELFPAAAANGWYVSCHFQTNGVLAVTLFDNTGLSQGVTNYTGVDRTHFGFYLFNNSRTRPYYTQDGRNGGPQALTFAGTGANYGDWWLCFQDAIYIAPVSTFTGAVLELQSVIPTPVLGTTWGQLKATYR